jgi:large subunit ribosomal protein L22
MLSGSKLKRYRKAMGMSVDKLAEALVPDNLPPEKYQARMKDLRASINNWEQGLYHPRPNQQEVDALSGVLGIERQSLEVWSASHLYAPIAPRKARLVAELIRGCAVQDALDLLKFANKRAAVYVDKVLRSAIANADEQEVDIELLYVCEARVDEGGVRLATRRWRPKDRGRAVSFTRLASHIRVSVDLE